MTDPLLLDLVRRRTPLQARLLEGEAGATLVRRRMKALGIQDPAAYRAQLEVDPAELEALVTSVAVPETWFFRYPASFEFLAAWLGRRLASRPADARLRMLSAPCATGQEPLSMAATALHAGWHAERIEIDAVDVSSAAIAVARESATRPLPVREPMPAWARSMFREVPGGVVASASLVDLIRFVHADVLSWTPADPRPYDVVFCRNFFIYLTPEARAATIRRVERMLAADGLLFVGHADHDARTVEGFRGVGIPHTFAYERRPAEVEVAPIRAAAPPRRPSAPLVAPRSAPRPARSPSHDGATRLVVATTGTAAPLERARTLADQGRLREAAELAERCVADDGPSPAALELLGCVRLAEGDLPAAAEWFRRLVYLDPDHESGLLHLAMISEDEGDLDGAERYRERARRASGGAGTEDRR